MNKDSETGTTEFLSISELLATAAADQNPQI